MTILYQLSELKLLGNPFHSIILVLRGKAPKFNIPKLQKLDSFLTCILLFLEGKRNEESFKNKNYLWTYLRPRLMCHYWSINEWKLTTQEWKFDIFKAKNLLLHPSAAQKDFIPIHDDLFTIYAIKYTGLFGLI